MYLTPHTQSLRARGASGALRQMYRAMTLWSDDISPEALKLDDTIGRWLTVIGIPSAFLLHGYVGFNFGSMQRRLTSRTQARSGRTWSPSWVCPVGSCWP